MAQCNYCNQVGMTDIRKEVGATVIVSSTLCCFFGFVLCSIIPCFIDELKDTVHECG